MLKFLAGAFFFLSATVFLNAQDTLPTDTSRRMDEVVITYTAENLAPFSFQNITSADIDARSTGQEPSFLLAETPSITVYSDAGNTQGYSYFRIRGIDQTRINISLDGVPLNEPEDQGAYFSNYPDLFNSVSRIQIQRGVGTSKNGTASYAGSVQLFSPHLFDSTGGSLGVGYGTFNSMRAFGEWNNGLKKNTGFYARASHVSASGYKYNSANSSQSVFLSGGIFRERSLWKVNLLAGHQENELAWLGVPDSLIAIDRRTNANVGERDRFTQCLFQLQHYTGVKESSSVRSSVYYTFLDGNYDFNLNGFLGLPSTDELYNYAFRSHLLGVFCNYGYEWGSFNFTAGVHGNTYQRGHTGSEKTFGTLYVNTGYKNELSAFAKADYKVWWFTLFADVQVRHATFDYTGDVSFDMLQWNFINPKAGVSAELNHKTVLYYSVGSTGREPTRNDMFGGNDNLLADTAGNALLFIVSPEYVIDHEAGVRFISAGVQCNLNVYYMDFKNEITLSGKFGPNGLALTDKVDQSFRSGIELNVLLRVNNYFSLVNNSSFSYSRITDASVEFEPVLTPQLLVNQELIFSWKGFIVALTGRYQGKSFLDYANTTTLDGYFILNGRAEYTFKKFQFRVFAANILNAEYYSNGYVDYDGRGKYFVQAPATLYGSITYSF